MFVARRVNRTVRVEAVDAQQVRQQHHIIQVHPDVTLVDHKRRVTDFQYNIYMYKELACTVSHLNAIRQAYKDDKSDVVLILEDDAVLSDTFVQHWRQLILEQAPQDWKVLQLASWQPGVLQHGLQLLDPFISWQPYHWSTVAYMINRDGMEAVLQRTLATGDDEVQWNLTSDIKVVADELIYDVDGAYTMTKPLIDSSGMPSTIQTKKERELAPSSSLLGSSAVNNIAPSQQNSTLQNLSKTTLLILMSSRIETLDQIEREVAVIRQDNAAVCQYHIKCVWYIHAVLARDDLVSAFHISRSELPPNIYFDVQVTDAPFNKFAYLHPASTNNNLQQTMDTFDLVLFKDNDQRIAGFPWLTFCHKKGRAILAGPLRQTTEEAFLYHHRLPKRQWFQIHEAKGWANVWTRQWSSDLFQGVIPLEVPFLEMYFVLMNGDFAHWFFERILTEEYVQQESEWGPDLMWCSAARSWARRRNEQIPGCYLVPVVSKHEDTQQIRISNDRKSKGFAMLDRFKQDEELASWMRGTEVWTKLTGGTSHRSVAGNCRSFLYGSRIWRWLGLLPDPPLDMAACTARLIAQADGQLEKE